MDAVTETNEKERKSLFYASSAKEVQSLVNAGACVNVINNDGMTPLIYAARNIRITNLSVVSALIDAGADVNYSDNEKKTALIYAVDLDAVNVAALLIKAGAGVNMTDSGGKTALFYAQSLTMVNLLVDAGAGFAIADNEKKTALFYAVAFDDVDVAAFLINAGADVNLTDIEGKTALFHVLSRKMVNLLVDAGAEFNKTDNEGKTAAHCAVTNNNEFAYTSLIDVGANVNAVDNDGKTALHFAVTRGTKTLIHLVINAGVHVNLRDKKGYTALYYAVEQHRIDVVADLIDAGADVAIANNQGKTALFYARTRNMVMLLTGAGADANETDNDGKTALHFAVTSNYEQMSSALVDAGVNVNAEDVEGKTALHHAIKEGTKTSIQLLIDNGADVNIKDNKGHTALFYAVETCRQSVATILIDAGADVTIANNVSKTSLFFALSRNMVNVLVDAGAEVNETDNQRKTALHCAVINNRELAYTALIDVGVNVNIQDMEGKTALHYAVLQGTLTLIQLLIDNGVDVNLKDNKGYTALFYAVARYRQAVVTDLIEAGADVAITDHEGKTVLFHAMTQNMVFLLTVAGAEVNKTDNDGKTALHYAVINNDKLPSSALVDEGANVNAQNMEDENALHYAVINNDELPSSALVDAGANVNAQDMEDENALHYGVINNNKLASFALVDAGADVNAHDLEGKTALFYAISEDLVILLTGAGAEVNENDNEGKTALHYAVLNNNEGASTALVALGANVSAQDMEGKTPLFYAISQCMVMLLAFAGAEIGKTDNEGETALHYAVINNDEVASSALIDVGANVNAQDMKGKTALFYSISEELVILLTSAGADQTTDNEGKTALHYAVINNNEVASSALVAVGANVNAQDMEGKTPLFYAISQDLVILLTGAGADLKTTDNEGKTALHYAVINNDEVASSALIDVGAEVNAQDMEGKTALFYAISGNMLLLLTGAGEEVNKTDNEGKTALHYAIINNDEVSSSELVDAGADVNAQDLEGKTPLFYAISREIVVLLTGAGAEVNETDNEGKTALHYAVINNNEVAASALIDVGANVNIQDMEGKTILHYLRGTRSLIHLLIKAGADINLRDKKGYTALFYAVDVHRLSVVTDLIDAGVDLAITDNEGKTALFYAVDSIPFVRELVEKGKCEVNVRDIYGRTPLFYAFTQSLEVARWLLAKRALLRIRDNCHLSILSFYIHNHFCHLGRPSILKGTQLFARHGISPQDVFQVVIDTMFCKILSSLSAISSLTQALKFAIENIALSPIHTYHHHVIGKILETVDKETDENKDLVKRWESLVPKVLGFLLELGANPNSVDSDGNTALHYATRLPYLGISHTTVMKICMLLRDQGASCNIKNHQNETPILFCLSRETYDIASYQQKLPAIRTVVCVSTFLVTNGASLEETSRVGESIFHLVLKIFQHSLSIFHVEVGKAISKEAEKLLELIEQAKITNRFTVNRRSTNLVSPLHLWASLEYNAKAVDLIYDDATTLEDDTFEKYLQKIFQLLLKFGAKLNERNIDDETPLHLCRSWAAAKLLLDAGANPNDLDSLTRTPLLVAARNIKCFPRTPDRFYPDVSLEPKAFWNSVLERGLDPWAVDKNGESVMSILVKSGAFALSQGLLEVACEKNFIQSQSIAGSLLNAVCKDESPRALWKSILVEIILKSSKSYLLGKENQDTPLHLCCRNIVREKENIYDHKGRTSAHWRIAEQLLSVGADCRIVDASGLSCLDMAKSCPELKQLLLKPVEVVQLLIPWMSVSTRYEPQLAKIARRQECEQVSQFWYHRRHLASGSFGFVFAGINEKDGREVAIKRIEKLRLERPEDKREISNLTALADCEQVVRYLSFYDDDHFSYVVLELMEGNLEEYLDSCTFDIQILIELCLDVVTGLKYLHDRDVLHRDLKPSNILYKTHPKLCLKIADFGLSRRVDSTGSISVYSTNVGTRCWIAPEVLKSSKDYSKPSDIFSCGLLLHYILAVKKHPFATPSVEGSKFSLLQTHETEANLIANKMEGWDESICPEARHLVKNKLDVDGSRRPTAADTLDHPLFWTKKKKMDLLFSVANQPEFECPRAKRTPPLTAVEIDLETAFSTIVVHPTWDDPAYLHMPAIYTEMMKKRKTPYDTFSVIELVRFTRNAFSHVSEDKRPTLIRKQLLEDFVLLEYFPNLVIEVFEAVTKYRWDQTREEVKYAMNK